MIKKIENENLIVEINEIGAGLYSIKSKKTGIEYLWQGNPTYWSGRAPILFPICGRLYGGKYVYKGKEYEMPIHGIVKTSEFDTSKKSDKEIKFILRSNDNTKKQYPFDFEFEVRYSLNGDSLEITYYVKNNDSKEMPFSLGSHPAFNVPFNSGETFEDYYIEFGKDVLDKIVLSDKCFYMGETQQYSLKDKKLDLQHNIFDNDALFFVMNTDKVKLKSKSKENYIEVSFNDMTCLGLWHTPKTDAPYVCIEPWHGIPSDEGKIDNLDTKRQTIKIQHDKTYQNTFVIKISEN